MNRRAAVPASPPVSPTAVRPAQSCRSAPIAAAIETLTACAQACTACADACLSESTVADLTKCIRTNLECADICAKTARVLSRHTGYDANISRSLLEACATACLACGDECAGHAGAATFKPSRQVARSPEPPTFVGGCGARTADL
jgi:hypothetical protein